MRTSREFQNIPEGGLRHEFANKKRNFFEQFAWRHKKHLKLFEEYGLLPRWKMDEDINPVTDRQYVSGDPLEHCLVEAVAAEAIAETLQLPPNEQDSLVVGILLHDFHKREDIVVAANTPSELKASALEVSASRAGDILRKKGYAPDVVQIVESVGHASLPRMISGQATLSEMIAHYIDDITVNTELTTLDERIDYLESNPAYYELNEAGRELYGGKTTFEVQREVGHSIEKKLAPYFGLSPEQSYMMPKVIREKINNKIENAETK